MWIVKRLEIPEEKTLCYKLIYKLKIPSSYLSDIKEYTLNLALCLIRGGWHGSMYEIIFSLNNWEQYLCACEMMMQGLHTEAYHVFMNIKDRFCGVNEHVYEWIIALVHITTFESSKTGGFDAFSHLGCMGLLECIYFHSEFYLTRYLFVNALNEVVQGKNGVETMYAIRAKFDKLLYIFRKPLKNTTYILKKWRDLAGMMGLCMTCITEKQDFLPVLKQFYPTSITLLEGVLGATTSQEISRFILSIPAEYPKQFFIFPRPISLNLHIHSDLYVKISKNSEFVLEFSAKVREISHKPPVLKFIFKCANGNKEEFSIEKEKQVSAAGVCSLSLPFMLNSSGIFALRIKASILNAQGREIGKPEHAEIILECI